MQSINTISVVEGNSRIFIICNENRNTEGYHEINIDFTTVLGLDKDDEAIQKMRREGLYPQKEVVYKTWITDEIYQGLLENHGLAVVDSDEYSIN